MLRVLPGTINYILPKSDSKQCLCKILGGAGKQSTIRAGQSKMAIDLSKVK